MAFGITKKELMQWKKKTSMGEIAFLTHFWFDERFPKVNTVTKAGCKDIERLVAWGKKYELKEQWIDRRSLYPHFDLMGERQVLILTEEGQWEQISRFHLKG